MKRVITRAALAQDLTESERFMLENDLALLDTLDRGVDAVDERVHATASLCNP